jgi:RNA polymerase sigma-70 factor (ECF subfamily)
MSHLNQNNVIYSVEEVKKLVLQAKSGDHSSFTKLYNAYFTPVYRYIYSRVHDKDRSEDIVQMVFIKWYKALPNYELKVTPLQYLFVIAKRLLIDNYGGTDFSSLDIETVAEVVDETQTQDEILDVKITTEKVVEQFKHLSETHQEVLRLHFFAELSTEEIAVLLNKKEPAIRQIKHRALIALRDLTQRLYDNN